MIKESLIKYFRRQTTLEEDEQIIFWFKESEAHRMEFASMKNLWTLTNFISNIHPLTAKQPFYVFSVKQLKQSCKIVLRYAAVAVIAYYLFVLPEYKFMLLA